MKTFVLLAAAAVILAGTGAHGQEKLKIGIIATLSGPPAVLGQQLRNGFNLAVKDLNGKLGGRDVEVIVADDELKPDLAVNKVKALVDRDKVDFVVGPIFSNILAAIMKPVTEGGAIDGLYSYVYPTGAREQRSTCPTAPPGRTKSSGTAIARSRRKTALV